ncbi:hypothetical protein OEZ86_007624 [Tetradesmus obliquus]|nr:hypothetical protein OEZ86_007624 [Tetradesmus obliquus]
MRTIVGDQIQDKSVTPPTAGSASTPGWAYHRVQKDNRNTRAENVAGNFWVGHTCIDCDTCRTMAPETFSRIDEQSAVHQQPSDRKGRVRALQALLSCPTFSIHVNERSAEELKEAQAGMPLPVPGTANCFSCGWRSEKTVGGESFIITRPQGNVMVDAPRYNPVLAKRIQEMGGIQYIVLTHNGGWEHTQPGRACLGHALPANFPC